MEEQYIPAPVDTADVVLPEELQSLAERIAENVHEVWAEGRMKEGWSYGPVRDDAAKKHPCLLPYSKLLEEEKDFDRRTSLETVKFILKLGFKLEK